MPDINVTFAGLPLATPIAVEPLDSGFTVDTALAVRDAGAGAIFLPVLDEGRLTHHAPEDNLASSNQDDHSVRQTERIVRRLNQDRYMEMVHEVSQAVDIPVIGCLHSSNRRGWVPLAQGMIDAGAAAIEVWPVREEECRQMRSDQIESSLLRSVTLVAERIDAPVIARLPSLTWGMHAVIQALGAAGVKGVILRAPDSIDSVDHETMTLRRDEAASDAEFLVTLRGVRILYRRVAPHLGVVVPPTHTDGAPAAAASGATLASVAVPGGDPRGAQDIVAAHIGHLNDWMTRGGHQSLFDVRGVVSESRMTSSLEGGSAR